MVWDLDMDNYICSLKCFSSEDSSHAGVKLLILTTTQLFVHWLKHADKQSPPAAYGRILQLKWEQDDANSVVAQNKSRKQPIIIKDVLHIRDQREIMQESYKSSRCKCV